MDFQCLQRLCFYDCVISDGCISHFIADKALEELELRDCSRVKGDFLNTIDLSALKSLFLSSCDVLNSEHLLSAVERLGELRELVLLSMSDDIFIGIQAVLDKMPKLEYLEINDAYEMVCHDYKPLSRLGCLKELDVKYKLPDEAVKAVLQGCKELRTLTFRDCTDMSSRGVVEALRCRGTGLRSLTLLSLDLDDVGLVAIISACPELTRLEVSGAELSPALPARAAAARRTVRAGARLWLCLTSTSLSNKKRLKALYGDYEPMNLEYEELIIELED
ncbi:uncharacterized protein LOC134648271 [Cydia amplana]|uniref:uncharacterized protein LOC134648271 n=1 Tax=Cydia amplana TaxID=1869771 RepID=UPI002FE5D467